MDRSNFTDRAIAARLVTEVLIPGEDVDRPGAAKCEKNHIWPAIFSLLASITPAPSWRRHTSMGCCHEGKVSQSFRWRRPRPSCRGVRSVACAVRRRFGVGRYRQAGTEAGLHTRRLSPLRGRNPQRAGDHRLPAAAEGQSQRRLQGGVRAVMIRFDAGPLRHRNRPEYEPIRNSTMDFPRSRQDARSRFQPCGGGLVTRPGLLGTPGLVFFRNGKPRP